MSSILSFINVFLIIFAQCVHNKNIKRHNEIEMQTLDDGQLIFAHTLCRHGDRNIFEGYPNDPYKSEENWPEGFQQLTNIGKQQHYQLGQYLRERYLSLLAGGSYSPNKVYVESTDVDRVLMSAQAAMAGMFPPVGDQIWNADLLWQPILIHVQGPFNEEYRLEFYKRCDRHTYKTLDYLNQTNFKGSFAKYKSLITILEENSGLKLNALKEINYLHDKLFIERLKGKRLPDWAENVMAQGDLEDIATLHFQMLTPTNDTKRMQSGFLLKEILDRFSNKTQSTLSPDRLLWMYFGHDTPIATMLNSLGLFEPHRPPYSCCIFFELYDHKDAPPYVQIFYRNTTADNIPPLEIPNCGTKCPLTKLYDLYKDILPTQSFDEECALRDGEHLPDNHLLFEI